MAGRRQYESDYGDRLLPGYRFFPTDLEIIWYLKRKINGTGQPPKCRLHEVDLYEHHPNVLTDRHRQSDLGFWYFLTSRERKYRNGNRPNRRTRDGLGFWKASQKATVVYDEDKQGVGNRTSLAYHEENNKTSWLMHEYTTILPNLPAESNRKMLTEWVLCKVYNTDKDYQTSHQAEQVRKRFQEDVNEEQTHVHNDEPSPRRRRLSVNQETNQTNEPNHVQIGETIQTNEPNYVLVGETNQTKEPDHVQQSLLEAPNQVCARDQELLEAPTYQRFARDQTKEPDHVQIQEITNQHSGNDVQMVEPVNNNNARNIMIVRTLTELDHQSVGINHNVHDLIVGDTNLDSNYVQQSLFETPNQVCARDQQLLGATNHYQIFGRDQQLLEAPTDQRFAGDQELLRSPTYQRFANEPWNYYGNLTPLPSTSYGFHDDPMPLTYDEDQANFNQASSSIGYIDLPEFPNPTTLVQVGSDPFDTFWRTSYF